MKAKELKEILKNVDDDNPIGFYLIGKEYTDEYDVDLGNPKVICSNGINGELDSDVRVNRTNKMESKK
jgi:hypothetical protein